MKTPGDLLAPIKTRGDFRRATESAPPPSDAVRQQREKLAPMWAAMAEAWGSAFVTQFGEEPNATWSAGLANFDLADVEQAIGKLIAQGDRFAPNLAQVIGELEKTRDFTEAQQRRNARSQPPALEHQIDPADRLASLRALRQEHNL